MPVAHRRLSAHHPRLYFAHLTGCGRVERKLLLVVRHGQAVSNYLGDTLGPDEWFAVEGTCQYDDKKGTVWDIFDAGECSM